MNASEKREVEARGQDRMLFFSGIPLIKTALIRRANVLARKLIEKEVPLTVSCIMADFYNRLQGETFRSEGVDVICFGQTHFYYDGERQPQLGAFLYMGECFKTVRRVLRYMKEQDIRRIVVFTTSPVSLLLTMFLNRRRYCIYFDIDDFTSEQWAAKTLLNKILKKVLSFLEIHVPRRAHGISTCSRYLQTMYKGAVVIPNMVELDYFKHIDVNNKYALFRENKLNVVFLGEIGPYHGHMDVVHAIKCNFEALKDKFHFHFIGAGSKYDYVKGQVGTMELSSLITMTGRLRFVDVVRELENMSFGIIPLARTKQNLARNPLKLFEYMVSYVAVVANSTPETESIITDGKNGFVTKDNTADAIMEKLLELYDKKDLLASVINEGYRRGCENSSEIIMKKWEEHFGIQDV